jgi:putative ABC transport system substrate-binding protein
VTSRAVGPIAVLVLGCLVAPLAAEAQQAPKSYRVGILEPDKPPGSVSAFRTRLADLGWTIQYESRYAEGRPERLPALAADLVRLDVNVLLTVGSHATKAAKDATATIPIVFVGVASPVEAGVVASLARPGGNVTGATDQLADLASKALQLITETVPKSSRIGVLQDSTNPSDSARGREDFDRMAQQRGLTIVRADVRAPGDVDAAFDTLSREHVGALIVASTPALVHQRTRVAKLALQNRVPTISYGRSWVEAGLLMSYSPNRSDLLRQAADYVDRILKGAKPADLPVVQPTKFDFVINMKTAKALGLTIPRSLLQRADHVVE